MSNDHFCATFLTTHCAQTRNLDVWAGTADILGDRMWVGGYGGYGGKRVCNFLLVCQL